MLKCTGDHVAEVTDSTSSSSVVWPRSSCEANDVNLTCFQGTE